MTSFRQRLSVAVLIALSTLLALPPAASAAPPAEPNVLLFSQTNDPGGNQVVGLRLHHGRLGKVGSWATGGRGRPQVAGTTDSQGAVALTSHGRVVLAVNAGSNTVTALEMRLGGLRRLGTAPTGSNPVSVTAAAGLVYVLNRDDRTIAGLRFTGSRLVPLPRSTRRLSAGSSDPAQVSFDPTGTRLAVTNRAGNRIDVFAVNRAGYAFGPVSTLGNGQVPFGFAFTPGGQLIVSNAGDQTGSTVSAYRIAGSGRLQAIQPAVRTGQFAACWVVVTRHGRYAYVANANSQSITGFAVAENGGLRLLDADGVTARTPGFSLDLATSPASRYVFNVTGDPVARRFNVVAFRRHADGSLTRISTVAYAAALSGLVAT
jgi:6-phosphogluconolactonase